MPPTKKTRQALEPTTPRRRRTPGAATESDIAKRAYQLFIERGGEHGRDIDDWLSAKRELSPDR